MKYKKNLKKIIYYLFLTSAFLFLPNNIRNIGYCFYLKQNILMIIVGILLNIFCFLYPLTIALIIRHHEKTNKWFLPKCLIKVLEDISNL